MAVIPERERAQLQELLERDLTGDVRLELFTQKTSPLFVPGRSECESCPETEELMTEVAELSDKLHLTITDVRANPDAAATAGVTQVPTLVMYGTNQGSVRFLGPPTGYEFSTLVADLVDLSNGTIVLSEATQTALREISEPVHIQVFSTPT